MRILWCLLLGGVLFGQTKLSVEATGCRHTVGDDTAFARPDFDDSRWQAKLPELGNPYTWSRCELDLSRLSVGGPFSVLVQVHGAWELYIDGQFAASHGDIRNGRVPFNSYGMGPISVSPERKLVRLALRRFSLGLGNRNNVFLRIFVGAPSDIYFINAQDVNARLTSALPALYLGAFAIVGGLLLLILYCSDWTQKELLWFGLSAMSLGMNRLADIPGQATDFVWGIVVFYFFGNSLMLVFAVWPFYRLAGKAVSRSYVVLVVIGITLLGSISLGLLFSPEDAQSWGVRESPPQILFRYVYLLAACAPVSAFWPLWRLPQSQYGVALVSLFWFLGNFINRIVAVQIPMLPGWTLISARNVQAWLSGTALVLMFVVITLRYRRVSKDRAELQGEMKSAQEVQRLLTSSALEVAPWASVDVAYLPAKEVGGDFYFCRQTPAGQLVVVGDVSGKGLRAAMLASVALGTLRHPEMQSPGGLLKDLNAALHGQTGGGFVTCCAALLRHDGQLTVANAGHPSPYVDGRELAVEAGLPLGIVADATYEEAVSQGTSITLISDGVVEAENAHRELFGFERTLEISKRSAQDIAEAARAWGQTDDITVVTVRRRV